MLNRPLVHDIVQRHVIPQTTRAINPRFTLLSAFDLDLATSISRQYHFTQALKTESNRVILLAYLPTLPVGSFLLQVAA